MAEPSSKGYKVLDPHVKALYGDSITIQRCEAIYKELESKGFAANNVSLGVGSFSIQCIEQDGILKPFTRDTFGMAVKATYGVINGKEVPIFKNPKTDIDHFKKSLKGLCNVSFDTKYNQFIYQDGLNQKQWDAIESYNWLDTIYKDSQMVEEEDLQTIRNRLRIFKGKETAF